LSLSAVISAFLLTVSTEGKNRNGLQLNRKELFSKRIFS
jgi:hypothetical protein